jgi:Ser/Thr protein kinase RdoA (MazF antagonist)
VHDEHVLFTGDEVTGIIDFGAVDFDAPAGDVARLLGSLVGDDLELWQRGLAAYCAVRPLTDAELSAVSVFHSSGAVIGAANWFNWLWGDEVDRLPVTDYTRPLLRLGRLTERLKSLAGEGD